MRITSTLLISILGCLLPPAVGMGAPGDPADENARLARIAPADTRLFLEVRDVSTMLSVPGGSPLAIMLTEVVVASRPAGTQPAGTLDLTRVVADAIGLEDPHTVHLMFNGRMGLAADGWSGLGDAVLLAEPTDAKALEQALAHLRVDDTDLQHVRLYRIGDLHELASDGHWVALGRRTHDRAIYARTVQLLETRSAETLHADEAFQSRLADIADAAQGVFCMRARTGADESIQGLVPGWPAAWPPPTAMILGVHVTDRGVALEMTGKLQAGVQQWRPSEIPIDALNRLPQSTLAAWTQSIDYHAEYKRLNRLPSGPVRYCMDLIENGASGSGVARQLTRHLVGDTLVLVGRHPKRFSDRTLILPSLAMAVESDNPPAVHKAMMTMAENMVRALNRAAGQESLYRIQRHAIEGGGAVHSVNLGSLFAGNTSCEWLGALELAWAVADRWLVMGTQAQTVREIVRARRGADPTLPVGRVHDALREVQMRGGSARLILLAQPQEAGRAIDSWTAYLRAEHPEMLTAAWWQELRRRHQASRVQLGLEARARAGILEVERTYPEWPAHGLLLPGDVILAVDGRPLKPENSFAALRDSIATRPQEERIVMTVKRGEETLDVELNLPSSGPGTHPFQPVELLDRLAEILRPFASASFASWQPAPDLLKAHVELKLHTAPPAEKP